MGTSSFALPILEVLVENDENIVAVYTQPPRPAGRGNKMQMSPIGRFAQDKNMKIYHPENFSKFSEIQFFKSLDPDLVVVVAYGLILPEQLLAVSKNGFFNVHASILPRWRGAAPIQRALLSNDKKTGVSIIKLEAGLDTGPIVLERHVKIEDTDNAGSLHYKLSRLGAKLTHLLCTNIKNLEYRLQDDIGVTYAKKIEKSESQIDWCVDAEAVNCQIRAFSPKPGAWFFCEGERIKILECQISNGIGKAGLIMDNNFQIACGEGSIFPIVLQRSGRLPMNIEKFLRGFKVPIGKYLLKTNF